MSGQVVFLGNGQSYVAGAADTIVAGAGSETVAFTVDGQLVLRGNGPIVFVEAGSDVVGGGVNYGGFGFGTIVQVAGPSTISAQNTFLFSGSVAAQVENAGLEVVEPATGVTTMSGAGDEIFANGTNLYFIDYNAGAFIENGSPVGFAFNAGTSNSTVVSAASAGLAAPRGGMAVNDGGVLNIAGSSSQMSILAGAGSDTVAVISSLELGTPGGNMYVTNGGILNIQGSSTLFNVVAGPGSETINGAAATGTPAFLAGAGNTSLVGGSGGDFFVVGSGSSTILAGPTIDTLVVVDGISGGSDLLQNWGSTDQMYFWGYGHNGIASQQVNGGSLTLMLTDQTRITLAGITSLNSSQVHFQ